MVCGSRGAAVGAWAVRPGPPRRGVPMPFGPRRTATAGGGPQIDADGRRWTRPAGHQRMPRPRNPAGKPGSADEACPRGHQERLAVAPVTGKALSGRASRYSSDVRHRLDCQGNRGWPGWRRPAQMPSLLSPSQVARLLNLHPNSMRRLAAEGRLRCQRVGWARVFELGDVQEFCEERRRSRRGPGAKRRTDRDG